MYQNFFLAIGNCNSTGYNVTQMDHGFVEYIKYVGRNIGARCARIFECRPPYLTRCNRFNPTFIKLVAIYLHSKALQFDLRKIKGELVVLN